MIFHMSASRRLDSIAIATPPTKTSYLAGETFDTTGMVVTATYNNNALTKEVTGYTVSPDGPLPAGTSSVTITYSDGVITKTATQNITTVKRSIPIPTVSGALTYTGNSQAPTVTGIDLTYMTVSGTTSAVNAGAYAETVSLRDPELTQWADGTTADKTLNWSIAKATGTMTGVPSSVTLDADNPSVDFTIGGSFDGGYTVASSDTSVATVALVSGTTYRISSVNDTAGTATITVTPTGGSNYTAPAAQSVGVEAAFVTSTPIGDLAVGSIVKMKVNGADKEFLVVHQGKPSSIYDDSCNGTWLLMKDIYENRAWHSSNVNDYANSTIHSYLNSTFLALFESNIQTAIKQVKIPYRPGSGTSMTVNSGANGLSAKIFLLADIEMGGDTSWGYMPTDGAKLDYFTKGNDTAANNIRIAYLNGTATNWWSRSPRTSSATSAWFCKSDGNCRNYTSCFISCGIRPALVLPSTATVDDSGNVN